MAPASKSSAKRCRLPGPSAERGPNKALQGELATCGRRKGSRNHALNIAAFNLGQIVADGHLERSLWKMGC